VNESKLRFRSVSNRAVSTMLRILLRAPAASLRRPEVLAGRNVRHKSNVLNRPA